MQIFACPFDSNCGQAPGVTLPENGANRNLQSSFRTNDACYYWIEASPILEEGSILQVDFFILKDVTVFVSIKENIDDKDVICGVQQGDTLVLKNPHKLYLSVEAVGQGAGFSINSRYTNSVTNVNYVN